MTTATMAAAAATTMEQMGHNENPNTNVEMKEW